MGRVTPDRTVTVATYNIHSGVGADGVLDLERLGRVLEETGAEVVALQEVDRCREDSGHVDQAAWFAERLGMEMAFGANLDLDPPAAGQRRRQYGTALLSRHPIASHGNTPLPRFPRGEQRGLLETVVDIAGHGAGSCHPPAARQRAGAAGPGGRRPRPRHGPAHHPPRRPQRPARLGGVLQDHLRVRRRGAAVDTDPATASTRSHRASGSTTC